MRFADKIKRILTVFTFFLHFFTSFVIGISNNSIPVNLRHVTSTIKFNIFYIFYHVALSFSMSQYPKFIRFVINFLGLLQTSKPVQNPFERFGGPQLSEPYSESSDMCGEFESLAQQGFPGRFPGRAESAGETRSVGKDHRRRAFSTSCGRPASLRKRAASKPLRICPAGDSCCC